MSWDLTLLPDHYNKAAEDFGLDGDVMCHSMLEFDRSGHIFDLIVAICNPQPIPTGVTLVMHQDKGLNETHEDHYGARITWTTAARLYDVLHRVVNNGIYLTQWNRAIFIMLKALPSYQKIYLYWH